MTTWRSLKRLGAVSLTPGAALLPFSEEHLEQLGWLAQEVEEMGGDAWVLPVSQVSEVEESRVRVDANREREAEYLDLTRECKSLLARHQAPTSREVNSLRRRLARIRGRDHYAAGGGSEAAQAVARFTDASKPSLRSSAFAAN